MVLTEPHMQRLLYFLFQRVIRLEREAEYYNAEVKKMWIFRPIITYIFSVHYLTGVPLQRCKKYKLHKPVWCNIQSYDTKLHKMYRLLDTVLASTDTITHKHTMSRGNHPLAYIPSLNDTVR